MIKVEEGESSSSSSLSSTELQQVQHSSLSSTSPKHKVRQQVEDHHNTSSNNNSRFAGARVPPAVLQAIYGLGHHKSEEPWWILSMQAFQAGCYKGIACQLYLTVRGGILGAVLFPVGLIGILLTGAELFTSDSLFMVAAYLGNKIHYSKVMRNMVLSWIFNFIGCLSWGGLLAYLSGQLENAGATDFAVEFAEKKAHAPWGQIFLRGIGANVCIALAVWQCTAAGDVAGKILGIWFPVVAFIVLGFDHSIANMFFIPVGMWYGADVDVVDLLFLSLLPATLGNIVGGSIGMGMVYWFLYDSVAGRREFGAKLHEALLYRVDFVKGHEVDTNNSNGRENGHSATMSQGQKQEMLQKVVLWPS